MFNFEILQSWISLICFIYVCCTFSEICCTLYIIYVCWLTIARCLQTNSNLISNALLGDPFVITCGTSEAMEWRFVCRSSVVSLSHILKTKPDRAVNRKWGSAIRNSSPELPPEIHAHAQGKIGQKQPAEEVARASKFLSRTTRLLLIKKYKYSVCHMLLKDLLLTYLETYQHRPEALWIRLIRAATIVCLSNVMHFCQIGQKQHKTSLQHRISTPL